MNIDLETLAVLILISIVTLIITTYLELRRRPSKPEYVTKEIVECIKCRYRIEQNFEPGDFISMYKGKCPKCHSPMKIKAIYRVEKTFKHQI